MCPSPPHLKHALFCLFLCAPEMWGPRGVPQLSTWLPCGSGGLPKPFPPGKFGHSLDRWPTALHRKQFMSLTPAMAPAPFVLPPAQPFIASWDLEWPTGFSSTCCAHLAPNPLPLPGAKPPLPLPKEGLASQCTKVVAGWPGGPAWAASATGARGHPPRLRRGSGSGGGPRRRRRRRASASGATAASSSSLL